VIALDGLPGSGKSTQARRLADRLGVELLLEATDRHPFIEHFYENPDHDVLQTELAFVLLHYQQLATAGRDWHGVADFAAYKDIVFADVTLDGNDRELFGTVYDRFLGRTAPPRLVIFLDLAPGSCLRRIQRRNRPFERGITLEYLADLRASYLRSLAQLGDEVHRLEVHEHDTREALADRIAGLIGPVRDAGDLTRRVV
jgi:deoxyguanosine kinase